MLNKESTLLFDLLRKDMHHFIKRKQRRVLCNLFSYFLSIR